MTIRKLVGTLENKGPYIDASTGHWFYWNGTRYVDSGYPYAVKPIISFKIEDGILYYSLFRLKLASGLSNIAVNDKIALTSTGAIKSDDGEYIAMHPVASSDDYKYIEVFRPYDIGTTGQT